MGHPKQDPEYLRAKYAFIRDLIQFHESRGTGLHCDPKINGKEVDLYLLYQIVTSHGGWEKINLRNEWDKLLEHFHLPRSTNGGIAIKQIYLRYLELYEKIHFLGEDVDAKDEHEDEYEDFRGRRRYPNKSSHHHSHHHHSSSSHHGHGHHHHHPPKEITDQNRSQLGLSTRLLEASDYEGLLLSLQSPLPNEQDMAISVCTLLSNETKHVLRFSKSPAILNMLLAHAGIYQDCGMRILMEETYKDARNLNHAEFWDEVLHHPDVRQLLCECFVKRVHSVLGLLDDEGAILSQLQELTDGNLPEEEKFARGIALRLKLARIRESREAENPTPKQEPASPEAASTSKPEVVAEEASETTTYDDKDPLETTENPDVTKETGDEGNMEELDSCTAIDNPDDKNASVKVEAIEKDNFDDSTCEIALVKTEPPSHCCPNCPCRKTQDSSSCSLTEDEDHGFSDSDHFSIERKQKPSSSRFERAMVDECADAPVTSLLFTKEEMDKVGQRIYQIAHILRNLSFEQDNAFVMARSPTLMRFLLISANCSFGSLAQASFDIIGNIASYIQLEEPLQNPLSSMLLTLVTSGVFSEDRFKILRSLEALRELTKMEGNEGVITRYIEKRVYERICDLLTLSDIMLLIYTLECILSMTGMGEAVCDEIVRVQGSVATLVSLVTVEAQSYGPKGCIQMRVVETVTGAAQQQQQQQQVQPSPVSSVSSSSVSSTVTSATPSMPSTPHNQQTVIHVPPSQHLLQQQLQQPPNPIYASPQVIPGRPSPANSPGLKIVSGTTTVVPPVVQGQQHLIQSQPLQKPVAPVPFLQNPTNSQVFTNSNSSSNLINHLSPSSTQQQYLSQPIPMQGVAAVVQKPSVLPSHTLIKTTTNGSNNNGNIVACIPQATQQQSPPPHGATMIVQQPTCAAVNQTAPTPGGSPVPGQTVNGAPTLVTANLPQISNHSLSQHHHVVTPSISLVTPRGTLSEEAWAIAWLKGTFESSCGTSIEQGEIYRMYSAARKNPNLVLSLEQFVQCVKCAYGGNVGPVIKNFGGGTSLSFFEGIKPKIAIRAVAVSSPSQAQLQTTLKVVGTAGANTIVASVSASTTVPVSSPIVQVPISTGAVLTPTTVPTTAAAPTVVVPPAIQAPAPPQPLPQITTASQGEGDIIQSQTVDQVSVNNNNNNGNNNNNASSTGATLPVSVHIPSREAKPSLSPILQATLSQPPKTKNNTNATGSKRVKSQKGKEKQPCKTEASSGILCQKFPASTSPSSSSSSVGLSSKGNSTLSPASSAIRSLLASKVVQRQQNKLQQQLPKGAKGKLNDKLNSTTNAITKDDSYMSPEVVKVNGIGPDGILDKAEESSASSSILSSDGSDNMTSNKSLTSFHGVLHNGQANLDSKNEINLEGMDDPENLKNRGQMKGMLIDLLERRVPSREPMNGIITGREIRISEKGLELIENMEESLGAPVLVNHSSSTCTSNDAPESQKMTFYSSTSDAQVTLQGQASSTACVIPGSTVGPVLSGSAVTLASGGGASTPASSNALKGGGIVAGQQVKLCSGKIVRVIEKAVDVPTIATAAAAAVPAIATPAVIAEVEVESTDEAPIIAPAFSLGDGLATSAATATNGDVAYVVSDSTQSSTVLVDVDSVIATAHSAPLVVDGNVVVVDSGEAMIVDGGGDGMTSKLCNDFVAGIASSSSSAHQTESNCSNGGGTNAGGGGDLLERFSQFSDLIVVPPEQLASLKRPSSPLHTMDQNSSSGNNPNDVSADDLPPPTKKQAVDNSLVDGTDGNSPATLPSITTSRTTTQQSVVPAAVVTSTAGLVPQTIANNGNTMVAQTLVSSTVVSTAVVPTTATSSLPPGTGAQVVQLPLRLSVNPQNPQQLTFTRQLVLPSGQQVLLSSANTQSPLQGQVIISKQQGTTTDQMPKAIIILQQQQQQSSGNVQVQQGSGQGTTPVAQQSTTTIVQQQAPVTSVIHQGINPQQVVTALNPSGSGGITVPSMKPQIVAVQQHPAQRLSVSGTALVPGQVQKVPIGQTPQQQPVIHQVLHQQQHQQQPVVLQHQVPRHPSPVVPQQHGMIPKPFTYNHNEGIKPSNYPQYTSEQMDMEFPFMCEWAGCGLRFLKPQQVSMHALKAHCPETLMDAVKCEWGQNGCDPLLRKRFSLMTHLQDRHCSKQALEMALYRRKNRIDPPPVPQQPLHHPGYAPNAAFHAIKRHAMSFMSTKEHLHDDNEGPVTKSIRLTSALILRNLVNYSALGRRILQGYESHLSGIAMSNVESSRTIAQLLHDMNERPRSSK